MSVEGQIHILTEILNSAVHFNEGDSSLELHLVLLLPSRIFVQDSEALEDVSDRDELLGRQVHMLRHRQPHRRLVRLEP